MLNERTRVVILTGAGISAESGIRTFRASDGLWENHRIEDVATPFAWQRDPELVWGFIRVDVGSCWKCFQILHMMHWST